MQKVTIQLQVAYVAMLREIVIWHLGWLHMLRV